MSIEALKTMKEQLMGCIQGQMNNLSNVEAKELGEAIDMVKDLSEAIYYCTITESMEKGEEEMRKGNGETYINYYTVPIQKPFETSYPDYREQERNSGYMYYPTPMYFPSGGSSGSNSGGGGRGGNSGGGNNSGGNDARGGGTRGYEEPLGMMGKPMYPEMGGMMRDPREGRSPMRRRMYMEGKETRNDTNSQLRELESYLQELSTDITEMIKDASPEERATLYQKMTMLANKIG